MDTWKVAQYTRGTIVVTLAGSIRCLAVVIGLSLSTASAAPGTEAVWEALGAPGSVVVLRHSHAPGTFDPPDARLDDCSTQRNLDDAGRAQARRIGEAFRQHGIEVGTVLSSPRCRCLDTARLAFGRVQPWAVLQGALRDAGLRQRLLAEVRRRIAAHESGPPLVLVTHGIVVTDLTGLNIPMGAFVVLRRGADGRHTVGGQLHVE
jgi:broad specificity phosphatase PhoE